MFIDDGQSSYTIGDFVFTRDGRNGQIVASVFDEEEDIEFFRLDTTGVQLFAGADLTVFAPGEETPFVSERLDPSLEITGFVTAADLTRVIFNLRQDFDARIAAVSGLGADAVADIVIQQVELFGEPLAADLRDLRNEQVALHAAQGVLFENLQSLITIGLSEIGNRLDSLDDRAQAVAGVTFFDLLGQLGTLLKDPLGFLLERGADAIQQEVLDGLTR